MINFGENYIEASDLKSPKKAPIILCCPHSGKIYPDEFIAQTVLDKIDIRYSEDAFIDEIITKENFDKDFYYLKTNIPRVFVDVNRAPDEIDVNMFEDIEDKVNYPKTDRIKAGFGVIPKMIKPGLNIYNKKLLFENEKYRINKYHRAYHLKLKSFVDDALEKYGKCFILDFHSMPKAENIAADIVLGDNNQKSCSPELVNFAQNFLINKGYNVWLNHPYAGGYTTYHYGNPQNNVNALQIEICRALYMKEGSIRRDNLEIKELKNLFILLLNELKSIYGT